MALQRMEAEQRQGQQQEQLQGQGQQRERQQEQQAAATAAAPSAASGSTGLEPSSSLDSGACNSQSPVRVPEPVRGLVQPAVTREQQPLPHGEEEQDRQLAALESQFVHSIYNAIAPHFAATRFAVWPRVRAFLEALPPGALLADVGCGNGKYFGVRRDVYVLGSDRSEGE